MNAIRVFALFALALLLTSFAEPGLQPALAEGPGVTFTVVSNNNAGDADPGNGICLTEAGVCTLRAAIQESNLDPLTNTIAFNIPGLGVRDIDVLNTALPGITDPVIIDATTQPGCTAPCVLLDGSSLPSGAGLWLQSGGTTIKGFKISGFSDAGIHIDSDANLIQGNHIGLPAGNEYGIWVQGLNNVIGGTAAGQRNVISGSTYYGIYMGHSAGLLTQGTLVMGNYIGTDPAGTAARPNGRSGIYISVQGIGNTVGGPDPGARNVISGNAGSGIALAGTNNLIQGNFIGTRADGTGSLGNAASGILIFYGAEDNLIGGSSAAESNKIAHNGRRGILFRSDAQEANTLKRNSIFANTGLGIDLGVDGVTPNDALDADSGPNGLQNYPIVSSATSSTKVLAARLFSEPGQTYMIEFFSSPPGSCDPKGYGEGKTFLGRRTLTTDATGYGRLSFISSVAFPVGAVITATATSSMGDTSEFSRCRTAH